MKYPLVPAGEPKMPLDMEKLGAIGFGLAKEICLDKYLYSRSGPETQRELYVHMGYIKEHGINTKSSYKAISQMERDCLLPEGQLRGLVDVALGKYPFKFSARGKEFLELEKKLMSKDLSCEDTTETGQ